ncbi:MAG: alpha/beta hydrolase fold domain-containing protein [Campylobacter sp.]|nr:alpha/beta hydrolase fold domain-containing protein [Campylobacter sp.]
MNVKNKINVSLKISDDMKKVLKYQRAHTSNETASTNEQMRKNYEFERKFWNEGGPIMFETQEISIKFEDANIRARIYYPNFKDEYKTIFFIHGGGFVVGSIDTHDRIMRNLAYNSKCAVIGIDYSLAPIKKFPSQIKECDALIQHVIKNSKKYKISPKFIAYAGDSSGANICMGTFLYQRENAKKFVKAMALFYGLYGLKDSASRALYGDETDGLRQEDIEFYYEQYLQKPQDMDCKFLNIFNADLTHNVPPCFIAACEFDPLKDDSKVLHEILKQNGSSKFKEYKGVMHAFLHFSKMMDIANQAIKDAAKFINNEFKFSLKELR